MLPPDSDSSSGCRPLNGEISSSQMNVEHNVPHFIRHVLECFVTEDPSVGNEEI